jgi:EAL domain-containing protein (putative c-di-GMP-specific phosphodiesterase class I)
VLSVNVSAQQFRQSDFVDQVIHALEYHAIDPHHLKLELTESLLLDDVEQVIASMEQLNARGVQFSLDDFGTGYSSLQYIKRLPLSCLKIDRTFVHDLHRHGNDMAIVGTIIAMAHGLKMSVIAEGVETLEQQEILRELGCESFQGYLYGKPVPIGELKID